MGVAIRTGVRVTGFDFSPAGAVKAVQTEQGAIRTEIVVNAGGMWAGQVGRMAGITLPMTPLIHQHLATKPVPGHEIPPTTPVLRDPHHLFYLREEVRGFLIGGFHVKGQVIDSRGVSAWGYGGQTMERGDWSGGRPSPNPADQANAWKKQTVLCEHELPGTARHDPLAYLQNRSVDWLDHQLAARELLSIDPAETYLVVEHEYPPARIQDKAKLAPILKGSLAFVKAIDEAAAAMYALQHEVLKSQGIPIQGVGREAYRS